MTRAGAELEAFVDEMLRRAHGKGYHPTAFIGMRGRRGTLEAISRLVRSGDMQSGFRRLKELGLLDWTIEAAVLKFPHEFARDDRECAVFRLHEAGWRPKHG